MSLLQQHLFPDSQRELRMRSYFLQHANKLPIQMAPFFSFLFFSFLFFSSSQRPTSRESCWSVNHKEFSLLYDLELQLESSSNFRATLNACRGAEDSFPFRITSKDHHLKPCELINLLARASKTSTQHSFRKALLIKVYKKSLWEPSFRHISTHETQRHLFPTTLRSHWNDLGSKVILLFCSWTYEIKWDLRI